ncbi:MAG: hypothetical protein E8D52_03925 [Nitrospira sp.]|nr:MAG: hypothetical protein E8D52_03925 [Nitrospira sp.]
MHKIGEFGEKDFLKVERAGYKNSNTPPRSCLALSGGGIRSAAYSIGVLKGLHLSGKLPEVDIISAVSGGSYAATWLYAQYDIKAREGSPRDAVAVLDDVLSGDSINKVAEKARNLVLNLSMLGLATIQAPSTDSGLLSLMSGGLDLITLVPRLILYTGGVIWSYHPPGSEGHETGSGSNYERALSNAFHVEDGKETEIESNYFESLWNRLPFSSVSVSTGPPIRTASKKLPYLIVNATIEGVRLSDEDVRTPNPRPEAERIRLADRIFEFTPYGMGSPSAGYRDWATLKDKDRAETYSFSKVASISGAAIDKRTDIYLNALGRDLGLGYTMLAPTDKDDPKKFFFQKKFIVLTDGGNEENLGVYGLIKRNCEEIIVVDAEYDGRPEGVLNFIPYMMERVTGKTFVGYEDSYQFGAYGKLKTNLEHEEMVLQVDELDQVTMYGKKTSHTQTLEPWSCWSDRVKTKRTFKCDDAQPRKGCVRNNEDNTCEPILQKQLRVTYVKLSADRMLLDAVPSKEKAKEVYGNFVTDFYKSSDKNFPHYSTAQLGWNKQAFLAIAELGCRAVRLEYDKKNLNSSEKACIETKRATGAGDSK